MHVVPRYRRSIYTAFAFNGPNTPRFIPHMRALVTFVFVLFLNVLIVLRKLDGVYMLIMASAPHSPCYMVNNWGALNNIFRFEIGADIYPSFLRKFHI